MARWYIIHAYSGFEGKVRDAIMSEATRMGLEQLVEQIEVPTETITTAIFVALMMVLLAVFFLGVDSLFGTVVRWLLSLA